MYKVIVTTAKGSYIMEFYRTKKEAQRIADEFKAISKEAIKTEVVKGIKN